MIVECEFCHKEISICPSRLKNQHICCSRKCSAELWKEIRNSDPTYMNCVCPICGVNFHLKNFHANDGGTHCCSMECAKILKRRKMSGENNHMYGRKNDNSPLWKGGVRISSYGYILIYSPDHPFRNGDDMVFEHRLVAEQYLLTDENSVEVDGKKYLSPDYVVHHIDEDKQNNAVDNLVVMRKQDHLSHHMKERNMIRDENGRFLYLAI